MCRGGVAVLIIYKTSMPDLSHISVEQETNIRLNRVFAQAIYVDDIEVAKEFYTKVLGMTICQVEGAKSCFLGIGNNPQAIYLEGGHPPRVPDVNGACVSFMLCVENPEEAFEELSRRGVITLQNKPMEMGGGSLWFQFIDPSGNMIEMVSMAKS